MAPPAGASGIAHQPVRTQPQTRVRQPFWHQGPVSWKTIFPWTGGGGGWAMVSDNTLIVHFVSIIITLVPLRSLGVRSWNLGTPALEDS